MTGATLVRTGRSPFQAALLAVSLMSGVMGLVLPAPGPSLNIYQSFGPAGTPILYGCLTGSAVVALIGMYWPPQCGRSVLLGLQIERCGLPLLAGVSLAYATASVLEVGVRALVAALLIGGIAVASLARTRQITTDIRALTCTAPGGGGGDGGQE